MILAAIALGLGLFGDRANHVLRQLDGPDLNVADLDAPCLGLGVEDSLDIGAEFLALRQHLIQLVLAQDGAQGGRG